MTDSQSPMDPSRTWINQELELIVSGAVVFSLFQLPEVIEQWWLLREGRFGGNLGIVVFLMYYLATLVTYALIVTFAAHFLVRGMWVALVGLRSVYPDGIDWTKIEFGRTLRDHFRSRNYDLAALEARVDTIASSMLALLFVFLIYMSVSGLFAAALFCGAWLLAKIVSMAFGIWIFQYIAGFLVAIVILGSLVVGLVDRRQRKDRRVPAWLEAAAKRMLPFVTGLYTSPLLAPVTLTFISYKSRRSMSVLLNVFMFGLVGLFIVNTLIDRDMLRFDSYIYLPVDAGSDRLQPRHYDNLRRDADSRIPSVSSDIVTGPYLRLFVPYDASEDNERAEVLCRDLPAQRGEALLSRNLPPTPKTARRQILGCFNSLYAVSLDGNELLADWIFAEHPDFGERGVMAYLPTAGMDAGRHLLKVAHRPLPDKESETASGSDEFYIPFWK